ncbi:PD40 domain-containing protein [bacterium]|nr:PD40 domain-containing protein [candidate division CSSED10-310 bacterium]
MTMGRIRKNGCGYWLIVGWLILAAVPVFGFGKNKVTYTDFQWRVHETDHFEFYYYTGMKEQMPEIVRMFESAYIRMSTDLGTELSGKIPVVLYRTYADFQQTNILPGFIPGGVGGFSEPIKRRIVIPLQGSKKDLEALINHELVHSFQFEILFQNRLNRIAPVPLWIMEGTAEHLASDWDPIGRMVLRDAVINNCLPRLENLESFDSLPSQYLGYKIAQSAVDFLRREYGMPRIRALLFEMRKTLRSKDYFRKAIKEIFDVPVDDLSARWQDDLRRRVIEVERRRESIVAFEKVVSKEPGYYRRMAPVFGVGDEVVHFIEATSEGLQIITGSVKGEEQEELKTCLTCSLGLLQFRQMITAGRPLSGCLDDGRLVFLSKYENVSYAHIVDPVIGGLTDSFTISQDAPSSPAFSPDGRYIAYAAWEGTRSDLFILDTRDGSTRKLTDDPYVDVTPFWSPEQSHIVYASERDNQFDLYIVDVMTGDSQVLLTSPADETAPAWSPDGKSIVYISDRIDGILDPYILQLESLTITRLAAPVTGCLTPSFSRSSREIVMVYYYRGSERIVVIPVNREPRIPDVGAEVAPLGIEGEMMFSELAEVEPPVGLPETPQDVDEEPVRFRLIPDYAVGIVGYSSNNDLLVEGGLMMSDILGDHQFELIGRRRDENTGFMARYMYLKNRIDYGGIGNLDSDYFYVYNAAFGYYEKIEWDEYAVIGHMEYPFSTFYRAELNLGYEQIDYQRANIQEFSELDRKLGYVEPVLAGDTVLSKSLTGYAEAYSGWRFRVSTRIPVVTGGEFDDYWNSYADFREYIPLGARSLLAFRQWGAWSEGDEPRVFAVGGAGTLRGFDYNRYLGSRVALATVELRFPLLDQLRFPGNISLYGFRGKFFVDAAAVWSKGMDFEWEIDNPKTENREGTLFASFGWGINFWLIGVEWHFEWARQTDFSKTNGDWYYEWSIRRSF